MRLLARNGSGAAPGRADLPVRAPAMDERFRRVCAVFADGRCLIAPGYEADSRLRATLLALRDEGVIAQHLAEETATPEKIAACWDRAPAGAAGGENDAIARRLGRFLGEAAAARASDIVFETAGGICRIHGIVNDRKLELASSVPAEQGREMTGFLFHSKDEGSAQTSYQRAAFQGFSVRAGGRVPLPAGVTALRCQRGPHEPNGDHLFARLFYRDQIRPGMTLEELGLSPSEAATFAEIRMSLHGGIFLGGTAGDGKSTTLATNLMLQMAEMGGQLNVVTIEDPVEYPIDGALQIAVPTTGSGNERSRHFEEALMHFCRVHPASGMVSEIRDADAARQVLQFIDTGHQVWTTIHVHSANAILFRLLDMGVGTAEVCKPDNIKLLMKQTLIPRLCSACALAAPAGGRPLPSRLAAQLEQWPSVRFRNPAGCAACSRGDPVARRAWNGYERQTAVAEMIRPDAGYLSFVRARDPAGAWEYWQSHLGGVPISNRIRDLVAGGLADPFDAALKGAHLETADSSPDDGPDGGVRSGDPR